MEESFNEMVSAVKDVITSDNNVNRLKRRIMRFKEYDAVLTYRLCESYLRLMNDNEVVELKNQMESDYDRMMGVE